MTRVNGTRGHDLLLPEGAHLLHIGPQKTGTTTIQVALHRSREQLREHGVVYPGKGTRPRKAVWSLLGAPEGIERPDIRHWHRLVREVEAIEGSRVCLSTEDWARTDLEGATKVLEGLGGDRPHVVVTARRLDKLLPSQWQQRVKMRRISLSYEEWLRIVLGDDTDHPAWRNIWIPHDIQAVTERWAEAAGGPENVTLIVADESDRALLPRTFEQMLGLPEGFLQDAAADIRNQSLGIGRIEAVRRVNAAFQGHSWNDDPALEALHIRLTDTLRDDAPWADEPRIPPLPAWAAERVQELSAQRAELVPTLGVRVVGDPANLRTPDAVHSPEHDAEIMVSAELAARAVEVAVEELLAEQAKRLEQQEHRVARLREKLKAAKQQGGSGRSVDEVRATELLGVVARRGVRRLKPGR